jgi:hypothetical protein
MSIHSYGNDRRTILMIKLLFIEDRETSDYSIYRILEAIYTKEYTKFIERNPNTRYRGRDSLRQLGCVCSASTLKMLLGSPHPAKIHEIIETMYGLGLVDVQVLDNALHTRHTNGKYAWYKRLEVTEKGMHYLRIYEDMLRMCDWFKKLGRLQ